MSENKGKKVFELTKEYTSEISGNKYVFQKVQTVPWLRMQDELAAKGDKIEDRARMMLEHVIVQPRLSIEDFDDYESGFHGYAELNEVVMAAYRFQLGR